MPFSQVSLPALARLQDDLPAFGKAYLRIVGVSAALAFPAIIGFAVLAPDAITLLYGDRWAESAKIAQVLGLMAVPFTINYFAGPALAALGRSGTLAKIAVLQLTLTIVLSLLAAPFGLTAIAAAYVLRAYLTLPVQMAASSATAAWDTARFGRDRTAAIHGPGDGGLPPRARLRGRGAV